MHSIHVPPLAALLAAGVMLAAAASAHAAVAVRVGGIGHDDEVAMQRDAHRWPLRMVFSERRDNEFAADVDVVIRDARGHQVLKLDDTGPMTYVRLPAGRYTVDATFEGLTQVRSVMLDGHAGQDLFVHWKGRPALDPFDGRPLGGRQVPG